MSRSLRGMFTTIALLAGMATGCGARQEGAESEQNPESELLAVECERLGGELSGDGSCAEGQTAQGLPGGTCCVAGSGRPEWTVAECDASGGEVIGDPGDGRVHRPDFECPGGTAPTAFVHSGIEGSVCCPRPNLPDFPVMEQADRPSWSGEQCAEAGGQVVGDPGDGRTHRPDFRCESGEAPAATVSVGIEGGVCCLP